MILFLGERQNFWMLPGEDPKQPLIHLTPENPGPVYVAEDKLTETQRRAIDLALRLQLIRQSETETPAAAPTPTRITAYKDESRATAERLLQNGTRVLQELIPKLAAEEQRAILEAMLELEEQGINHLVAPRKTVVQMLARALETCGGVGQVKDVPETTVTLTFDTPAES